MSRNLTGMAVGSVLALILGACNTLPAPDALTAACPALKGSSIPSSAIGLPSGAGTVTAAELIAAATGRVNNNAYIPGTPQYCKVTGSIAPRDPAAQAIIFQVNLPIQWNGKALQYGGGGLNGTLITGLLPLRDAAPGDELPLARGYVTYGTDSGHQASSFPPSEPGTFALNDEMLENFAYASYKKVKDATVHVTRAFYGQAPKRVYYFGGSEGGREGLTMAQRFPADYDGIVSVVPVINWTGLFHAFIPAQVAQQEDWLDAPKAALIAKAVSDACDNLDGLTDGVVNNYTACQSRVNLQVLRCLAGNDAGSHCLSDAELAAIRMLHSRYTFPFPLANGITSYPQWMYGHEDSLDGPTAMSLVRWVSGTAPPSSPINASTTSVHWLYGSNWIRYAIARNGTFDVRTYRPENFTARLQQTSALVDSTNPDLSAFFARGGKLIMRENMADRAQSPLAGIEYYQSVVAKFGQTTVDRSVRLYISPSSTHSGNARSVTDKSGVPTTVDLLDPLDRWVTDGVAPAEALMQTRRSASPPFVTEASRPMCRYPMYPHYVGGDQLLASSYQCRISP